jgi:membrane protein DedA with SNARE-associated domain
MDEISQSLAAHGELVLFAVVFVDQAGLPLPSAPWLLGAGALCASGRMNAAAALGISVIASVIADVIWFYAGRRGGNGLPGLLRLWSWVPPSVAKHTRSMAERHSRLGLVVAKFLPGLGFVMPALAGALGVSVTHFLLFDGLGAVLYGAAYIMAGIVLHNQLQQALLLGKDLGFSAGLLAVVLVAAYLALKFGLGKESKRYAMARSGHQFERKSVYLRSRCREKG